MTDPHAESSLLAQLSKSLLREQRTTRRWNLFLRLTWLVVFLAIFGLLYNQSDGHPVSGPHAAVVDLNGVMGVDYGGSADVVVDGLEKAFASKNARGIILRLNSPGGSPVQAGILNDEIQRLRKKYPEKPLVGVVTEVCASGCYYAAVALDKIYADKSSIVGSIGVRMDGFGFVDAIEKLGIERRLLTAGRDKGILDPFSPVKEGQREHAQKLLNRVHRQFIDAVEEGRGSRLHGEPDLLFSGLFWTGEEAVELGLVDDLGSPREVARTLMDSDELIEYTPEQDFWERMGVEFDTALGRAVSRIFFR
ncbi:MAG: S49 family peptidase [Gammaproteobacteria bacterium]|jgi:protease-4|nr:S49 family peptidase [Gammaproteobacteria bacterium]